MGIISLFGISDFFPESLEWALCMMLRRSGSCDVREHTSLSQPLKQCREAAVVDVHLVRYTYGSVRLTC